MGEGATPGGETLILNKLKAIVTDRVQWPDVLSLLVT